MSITQEQTREFLARANQELGPIVAALWNYWSQQESMTAEDAIRCLVSEHATQGEALRAIVLAPVGEVNERWRSRARQALAAAKSKESTR